MTEPAFVLYDLAAADPDVRFSPHCWKTRMAIAHKGLLGLTEFRPWRFTEKEEIAFSGSKSVPVLVQGERVVADSWKIALYLEKAYPEAPSLFGGTEAVALCTLINDWVDLSLMEPIGRVVISDLHARIADKDKAYFRTTRERWLGNSFEALAADREGSLRSLRKVLAPLRKLLRGQPYLSGQAPGYADYCVFGLFMWARSSSPIELLGTDDSMVAWRDRLLDAYNGFARRAPVAI